MNDIHQIAATLAARYKKQPKRTGNGFDTNCPCHEDDKGSLSIGEKDGKLVVRCQAGCEQGNVFKEVLEICGLTSNTNGKSQETIYEYRDASGKTVLEKVRLVPKSFYIRQPNGNGGYVKNDKDKHTTNGADITIPYRLPEILQAIEANEAIWIVEGEKDCDNLAKIGLIATCNIYGASQDGKAPKWTDKHTKWLAGINGAVILPDNDDAGRAHATAIAKSLARASIQCKILHLPGLPGKGDVSDWLVAGGTKEQLEDLAANAEVWTDERKNADTAQPAGNNEPEYTLDEVKAALDAINKPNTFEWLNVGHALKGAGLDLELWESWTKEHDPHYSPGECAIRWTMREFKHTTFNIRNLWSIAAGFGFEKAGYAKETAEDDWQDPEPITDELLPVPPLLPEMLPEPYRAYVIDVSERMSCPPEFAATALLTITGSLIGTTCGIKPKRFDDDWLEVPNIWGAVVAEPGQFKSPAIDSPGKFLSKLQKTANESNKLVMQKHIAEYKAYDAQEKALGEQMNKIAKNTLI